MHQYGVREVERLLHLPRSTIKSLVNAGFVSPARGPRKSYLFSFRDLIVLRTAQALAAANVPPRRITKSLKELRRHLPDAMPLSGLSIGAVGDRVVVSEGASRWQAESGQYLLAFDGDPDDGSLSVSSAPAPRRARSSGSSGDASWSAPMPRPRGRRMSAPSKPTRSTCARISTWEGCCTKPAASRMRSASIAKHSRLAATIPCCSTTSAFCWRTWTAGPRRWKPTKERCTAIRASRTVFTIWGCCARPSANPGRQYGTWRSIESWSNREDERKTDEVRPDFSSALVDQSIAKGAAA